MRAAIVFLLIMLPGVSAADALCDTKFSVIEKQYEDYNQKSANTNAMMDRLASQFGGGTNVDISQANTTDLQNWYRSIVDFIPLGQSTLQNLMEFKALGCAKDAASVDKMIDKGTSDLRLARKRAAALEALLASRH